MVETGVLAAGGGMVAFEPYDPLAPRRQDRALRRILIVSIAIHVLLLFVFWDSIIGVVLDDDDTVTVRMVEEKPPPPRPKVIAQTRVNTKVQKQRDVKREVVKLDPIQRMDQVKMTQVDPLQRIEAPKVVDYQDLDVTKANVFADTYVPPKPMKIDTTAPTVKTVQSMAKPSAGPKRVVSKGTSDAPTAVESSTPQSVQGVLSSQTVQGADSGAKIAALRQGTSDRFLQGDGDGSSLTGAAKDCMKDPVCIAYLKLIEDRVYARWSVPSDAAAGRVVLSFRIDRGGSAHNIREKHSDDAGLGKTCLQAFRHASPFPPPPHEIQYLVNKGISATFRYGN
jgi:TonB family protein